MHPSIFGLGVGTLPQWGMFLSVLTMVGGLVTVYIKGIPERLRVANETKVAAAAELADRFKAWREEVHDLKNDMAKLAAKQKTCDEALAEAHALNRWSKDQNKTMLFIIKLLISELKRLDPKSIIVKQAEDTLLHMNGDTGPPSNKSDALISAEEAVIDAKQTLASTRATREEVKHSEEDDGA